MGAPSSTLILGGARSGKSRYAVGRARSMEGAVAFVATAWPIDAEMTQRIERHRAERPADWLTVEAPLEVAAALRSLVGRVRVVVLDCLTLWVANRMQQEPEDGPILAAADELAKLLTERPYETLVVSNEVGLGVHPETAAGLRFRDLLGLVNQTIASVADCVVWMTAGLPLVLKEGPGRGCPRQAP